MNDIKPQDTTLVAAPSGDLNLLDIHDVTKKVSLGKSTIYRMMDAGNFPLSVTVAPRTVRWLGAEIDAWIAQKMGFRRTAKPQEKAA